MNNPRVILLYISEISGHHSATLAIEKAIKTLNPQAEILNINAFNYTNPVSEKIVNKLYMGVIKKTPRLWDYLYDNPRVMKRIENFRQIVHRFNSPKFKSLFDKFRPQAVACTQAFPCGMVADFKRVYNSSIPLIAVLTDYISHSYWIHDTVDYYIAPSQDVRNELLRKAVKEEKIKTFGIPFDFKFNQGIDRKKVLEKWQLNDYPPIILLMGGGQGLGPMDKMIKLLDKSNLDIQLIVVCGTNKKLYYRLKKRERKFRKKIIPFGYYYHIEELMAISKIIITKPGGITTAEALANRLPILIVNPIPGQEESNTLYFTKKGAAVRIDNPVDIGRVIEDLLLNPTKLKQMSDAGSEISKPNAALDIAKLILRDCARDER